MPIGAIVGGIASVGSSLIGGSAAGKAADAQAQAAKYAADLQNQQYQQTRQDLAPWRNAGSQAIGTLSDMLQPGYDYTTSPGYQFRFNEGQRAVESSAASKGLLMSGGNLKALTNYGQGVAADDFNQQFGRVATVAGAGQQAATNLGQLGAQSAANQGNYLTQAGQARASGYIGQANAITGGLNNLTTLANQPGIWGGGGSSFQPSGYSLSSMMTPFSSANLSSPNWRDW